jgi:hypothetical protein
MLLPAQMHQKSPLSVPSLRHTFNNEMNPSKTRQERTTTVQLTLTDLLGQSPHANAKITRSILDRMMRQNGRTFLNWNS